MGADLTISDSIRREIPFECHMEIRSGFWRKRIEGAGIKNERQPGEN
jgi:hypothetical protein